MKDSVYLTPTSKNPFDPLSMACHLAERSGQAHGGSYGFENQWFDKYNHTKFIDIKQNSHWCTFKRSNFANENSFRGWVNNF